MAVRVVTWFVPFLFALCFHEYAHGFIARMRGDNTAELYGRLTMNPIPHMDLIGTVILPISAALFGSPIFFGWAKPVPVNPRNLKNPRVDMFWIALAGPLSNILLALVGALLMWVSVNYLRTVSYFSSLMGFLDIFIGINLFLAFFNIIPLHPLDGGKVLARFLPHSVNAKLEENEHISGIVLLVLILGGALSILAVPVMWGHSLLRGLAIGAF